MYLNSLLSFYDKTSVRVARGRIYPRYIVSGSDWASRRGTR